MELASLHEKNVIWSFISLYFVSCILFSFTFSLFCVWGGGGFWILLDWL